MSEPTNAVQEAIEVLTEGPDQNLVDVDTVHRALDILEEIDDLYVLDDTIDRAYLRALEYSPEPFVHEDIAWTIPTRERLDFLLAMKDSDWADSDAFLKAGKYGVDPCCVDWMMDVARETDGLEEFMDAIIEGYEAPNYPTPTEEDLTFEVCNNLRHHKLTVVKSEKRQIVRLNDADLDHLEETGYLGVAHIVFHHSSEARNAIFEHDFTGAYLDPHDLRDRHAMRFSGVLPDEWVLLVEYEPESERGPKDCGEFHPLPCGLDVDCAENEDDEPDDIVPGVESPDPEVVTNDDDDVVFDEKVAGDRIPDGEEHPDYVEWGEELAEKYMEQTDDHPPDDETQPESDVRDPYGFLSDDE